MENIYLAELVFVVTNNRIKRMENHFYGERNFILFFSNSLRNVKKKISLSIKDMEHNDCVNERKEKVSFSFHELKRIIRVNNIENPLVYLFQKKHLYSNSTINRKICSKNYLLKKYNECVKHYKNNEREIYASLSGYALVLTVFFEKSKKENEKIIVEEKYFLIKMKNKKSLLDVFEKIKSFEKNTKFLGINSISVVYDELEDGSELFFDRIKVKNLNVNVKNKKK